MYTTENFGYSFIDNNQIDKEYIYNKNIQYYEILSRGISTKFLTKELSKYKNENFYIIADGNITTNLNPDWEQYQGYFAIPSQDGQRIDRFISPEIVGACFSKEFMNYIGIYASFWYLLDVRNKSLVYLTSNIRYEKYISINDVDHCKILKEKNNPGKLEQNDTLLLNKENMYLDASNGYYFESNNKLTDIIIDVDLYLNIIDCNQYISIQNTNGSRVSILNNNLIFLLNGEKLENYNDYFLKSKLIKIFISKYSDEFILNCQFIT